MGNSSIVYSHLDHQIEKLLAQGLIINNVDFAKEELQLYGYSNLIKSYREPYTYIKDGQKVYRSGVTFEQIWSLYILDKNLRNAVMAAMLDLEEFVKESAADVIAASFGTHPDEYLNYRNYLNIKKHKERFSLAGILDKLKNTLDTNKDPIFHYSQKYSCVPPWILFKSIYFSTIINFINMFKPREKQSMVSKLYDVNHWKIDSNAFPHFMMDTLFICLEYRNLAAHGGRIYNHICDYKSHNSISETLNLHGFSQLLFLLQSLNYQAPYQYLDDALSTQLNRHCRRFPSDITYLGQVLNIDITPVENVWITEKSNTYHTDPHCSGMKSPIEIELSKAEAHGLKPCKRCCK